MLHSAVILSMYLSVREAGCRVGDTTNEQNQNHGKGGQAGARPLPEDNRVAAI